MSDVKETSCRLCLKTITDKGFEVIDNVVRDILHGLLLKLKFDGESKEVICNVCRRKLNAASEFKSTCLNTDNTIIPYLDSGKMLQLDLREVYMQEKKSKLVDISCSRKICRLCMHPVESEFRCIREEELEAIEKLAPEMNINMVKDPVVCKPCFDCLCTHNSFLKDCLEVEQNIKGSFDNSATENRMDTSPSDLFIKTENLDREFDTSEMKVSLKVEYVDVKDEERSVMPLQSSNIVPFVEIDCKDAEEGGFKDENGSANECNTYNSHYIEHKGSDKCDEHDCKIKNKALTHRDASQLPMYKCKLCNYKSKKKILLISHQLVHKDPSQVKMYRCNECDFETKYRENIKQHQLRHKDPLQVQMYICEDCPFESKYKSCFNKHQLKHKDPSQVQMYICKYCPYESKYRSYIKKHQLKHKDSSQIQMYKCNDCDYETKYKNGINRHQLKHKDPSQVQMYKCSDCNYETKYQGVIKRHQLKHNKVQMYRCSDCDYGTKYRSHIERHKLNHKEPSQVQVFRCNVCNYESNHKHNFTEHLLSHKDPSQIQMYKCNKCNFETKYKGNMKKHQLKHEDSSQVHMYRCNDCDYETKYKYNIKTHQLKHKVSSQV